MDVVSFFAGCGGLDCGFEKAGFRVVWADEFEPSVHATYMKNHPDTPVRMAEILAVSIKEAIEKATAERKQQRGEIKPDDRVLVGFYKGYPHWKIITHQGVYYVRADG